MSDVQRPKQEATISLTASDAYEVLRLQTLRGTQEELVSWAKRRLWFLVALMTAAAALGSMGVWRYIEALTEERIDSQIRYELIPALERQSATIQAFEDGAKEQLKNLQDTSLAELLKLRAATAVGDYTAEAAASEADSARRAAEEATRHSTDVQAVADSVLGSLAALETEMKQLDLYRGTINAKLSTLQSDIELAIRDAAEARESLLALSQDRPVILAAVYSPTGIHTLYGRNFGAETGSVEVTTSHMFPGDAVQLPEKTRRIAASEVRGWTDSVVEFAANWIYVRTTGLHIVHNMVVVELPDGRASRAVPLRIESGSGTP